MRTPAHYFDLGGTLLALDDHDEIAYDEHGRVTILPGVRERLTALAGTPVFVVTNQAGIADGTLTAERFHDFCTQLSTGTGNAITAYAACTHPRHTGCICRKPKTGLVLSLAETHRIDLERSVMVGDTHIDQRLAADAGIGHFTWAADYFGTNASGWTGARPGPAGSGQASERANSDRRRGCVVSGERRGRDSGTARVTVERPNLVLMSDAERALPYPVLPGHRGRRGSSTADHGKHAS